MLSDLRTSYSNFLLFGPLVASQSLVVVLNPNHVATIFVFAPRCCITRRFSSPRADRTAPSQDRPLNHVLSWWRSMVVVVIGQSDHVCLCSSLHGNANRGYQTRLANDPSFDNVWGKSQSSAPCPLLTECLFLCDRRCHN